MAFWNSIPQILKKIFSNEEIDANAELKSSIDKNTFKFIDFSNQSKEKIVVKTGGQAIIFNLGLCSLEEKKAIMSDMFKPAIEDGQTILRKQLVNKSKQLKNNLPKEDDEKLLLFYKGKLSAEYLEALEMSLIVKSMGEKGEEIREVKGDIIRKYPQFGKNLSNLVSGGYFNGHFIELYDEMFSEDGFTIEKYRIEVERTVVSSPFTKFINPVEPIEQVIKEILYKVEKLRGYGASKFIVHALSVNNVKIAGEVLAGIEENDDSIVIEYKDKTLSRLTATLKF